MKLYTYIVTKDTGLAPNPFWNYCTLSCCTPNHQGSKIEPEDWVAGFTTKSKGYRLIYAMLVSEVISLNEYFHDDRFLKKKPNLKGNWKERCGDNFYSIEKCKWKQHRNRFHEGNEYLAKDTKKSKVFIAKKFMYFGENAFNIPSEFSSLVGGRGTRVNHNETVKNSFINWLIHNHEFGIHGLPADNPDRDLA